MTLQTSISGAVIAHVLTWRAHVGVWRVRPAFQRHKGGSVRAHCGSDSNVNKTSLFLSN